jgi:hypothetical protein
MLAGTHTVAVVDVGDHTEVAVVGVVVAAAAAVVAEAAVGKT